MDKEERKKELEKISQSLTINEIGALAAMKAESLSISKAKRFGLFPIENWATYNRMLHWDASYWDYSEVRFTNSRNDFVALSENERQALLLCFAFFAVGDGSITSLLAYQMILNSTSFEEQLIYVYQLNIERIHGITYARMIETFVPTLEERNAIFKAVENVEPIKKMNEFIEEAFMFPSGKKDLYIALAISEYLFFTPLFAIIFWFKAFRRGKIPDVIYANELIAKDECSHCANGCANYLALPKAERFTEEEIGVIIRKAVALISNFADYMVNAKQIKLAGLTYAALEQYIQFIADDLLLNVKHTPIYNVSLPKALEYMTLTKFEIKTNFYEGDVSAYRRFNPKDLLDETKELNAKFDPQGSKSTVKKPIKF